MRHLIGALYRQYNALYSKDFVNFHTKLHFIFVHIFYFVIKYQKQIEVLKQYYNKATKMVMNYNYNYTGNCNYTPSCNYMRNIIQGWYAKSNINNTR